MEFDLRELLLILGPLFISVILMHGYWRMRNNRNTLKMALDSTYLSRPGENSGTDDLSMFKAELPNGGARVIRVQPDIPEGKDVPVLMEPVDLEIDEEFREVASKETLQEALEAASEEAFEEALEEVSEMELDEVSEAIPFEAVDVQKDTPAKAPPARMLDQPELFIVINVMSDDDFFDGQGLLETLVETNMTHGDMSIFHRLDDNGFSEFSLTNAVEPGTFDLNDINSMQTPGVTMFMGVHELADPCHVYEELLNVATIIAEELGGSIQDQTRSVMTSQTIEHCRQEIRDFQFRHSA